ncbi:hypothetical protein D3C81_1356460 [compost metagenome]
MAWEDNFSSLIEDKHPIDEKKEWRFVLEEHKSKGTLHINVRAFQIAGTYTGPTKNGINIQITSKEDLDEFQEKLNKFFDKAKEML